MEQTVDKDKRRGIEREKRMEGKKWRGEVGCQREVMAKEITYGNQFHQAHTISEVRLQVIHHVSFLLQM
jgi:hypothetical protein